jgi:hypothetical protein
MAATSRHHGDISIWIEKVIDSCETPSQELSARRLVRLYEKQYSYLEYPVYRELTLRLQNKLNSKFVSRVQN